MFLCPACKLLYIVFCNLECSFHFSRGSCTTMYKVMTLFPSFAKLVFRPILLRILHFLWISRLMICEANYLKLDVLPKLDVSFELVRFKRHSRQSGLLFWLDIYFSIHILERTFSNFSCRFLNPNYFFQFEL